MTVEECWRWLGVLLLWDYRRTASGKGAAANEMAAVRDLVVLVHKNACRQCRYEVCAVCARLEALGQEGGE